MAWTEATNPTGTWVEEDIVSLGWGAVPWGLTWGDSRPIGSGLWTEVSNYG